MNKDFYTIEVNETVNTFLDSLSDDELRSIINDTDQESRLDDLVQKCPIVSVLPFLNQLIYGVRLVAVLLPGWRLL